ncbi:uncharacterized protein LOC124297064 [Neodiprion virginianus]|uniref:uncharacterized protein LOC124297064 n=1 Tax=Neodiprion virginianus TaxID=2961670 RepID=UPI001EE75DC9|nr:uncharacterized protein LOC124297064 [Neodiprion virginianus]
MPERTARKLVALGKIKIGWTVCRIRERVAVDRCHRCQGYGYHATQCLGPDNSNACRKSDLLTQTAAAQRAEILIVSEPSSAGKQGSWLVDRRGDAAIAATNNLPGTLTLEARGEGFVWARTSGLTIFSCYFSPNVASGDFEAQLDSLEASIRTTRGRIIVAGDFNAKSPSWGSSKLDARGQAVAELLARLHLLPINVGAEPTWYRESTGSRSVIDIMTGKPEVVTEVQGWRVLEDETLSDHRYLFMSWVPEKR